jgi:hypothetical protein
MSRTSSAQSRVALPGGNRLASPKWLEVLFQDLPAREVGQRAEGACFLVRINLSHVSYLAQQLNVEQARPRRTRYQGDQ